MQEIEHNLIKKVVMNASIFHKIYSFLNIKDLAYAMRVSIEFYKLGNEHFKLLLEKFHLIDIDPFTNAKQQTTLLEQEKQKQLEKKYNQEYKKFFCREILVMNCSDLQNYECSKVVRYNNLFGKGIKKFEMGVIFSGFLLYDKTLLYTTTQQMTTPVIQTKFEELSQVKQFSTVGKQLVCLQENGIISIIFSENNEYIIKQLKYSQTGSIIQIRASGNYIVILENGNKFSLFSYIDLQHYAFEEEENKRLGHIVMEPTQIKDFGVTNSVVFIVTEQGELYECEVHQVLSQDPSLGTITLKVFRNKFFSKKKVSQIYCQMFYYFVVEEEFVKSIEEWDNKEVVNWVNEIGFEDYAKIIQYENIVGKELINCDKQTILKDRLGLTREDLQTKFITEINQNLKGRIKKQVIWGAGANNFAQLGLDGAVNYNQPQKINLKLDSGELVYKIKCGWKNSGIITNKGKFLVSRRPAKQQQQQQQADAVKNIDKEPKFLKKNDIKQLKKYIKEETLNQQDNSFWVDISPFFANLKDYREYQLLDISIAKDTLSVLSIFKGMCNEEQISKKKKSKKIFENNQKQQQTKQKFKPATQILDRIQWDTNLNPKDFVVAYEDRFLGVIEVPFEDFIQTEAKDHRIQYLKKRGEVIWDRKSKTNLF